VAQKDVVALRLYDHREKRKQLPKMLKTLDHLEYLTIPAHLIPKLTPDMLQPSVRTLVVETQEPATMPEGAVFPHIENVVAPAPLFFEEGTFPALDNLGIRFDKKQKMLPIVGRLRKLRSLGMGPVSDGSVFEPLAGLADLTWLGIGGGNLPSLNGIEQWPALESIRLHNLPKLADIGAIEKLDRLEQVEILYCPSLASVNALARLPSLRRLELIGCKDKSGAIAAIRPALEKRGLERLIVS
jgi:hypothetical protein